MRKGFVYLYYGDGKGKTTAAIGQAVRAVGEGLTSVMVQFLDYNNNKEYSALQRFEPDFRVFRFEKERQSFNLKDEALRKEIKAEINTAFNFSRKIIETGECDILILDGVTEACENGFVPVTELRDFILKRQDSMDLILIGSAKLDEIEDLCDYIFNIKTEKKPNND